MTKVSTDSARPNAMVRLCRELDEQPDTSALVDYMTHLFVDQIRTAEHCTVSVLRHRQLSVAGATSFAARDFVTAQITTDEGPCVSAAKRGRAAEFVDDWAHEVRWPVLQRRAIALGIHASRVYQLAGRRGVFGIVSVDASIAHAFDDETDRRMSVLMAPCAIALSAAQLEADLRLAIESRDVIGQAKGILMERFRVGADEAFAILVGISQRGHRRLQDVACEFALGMDVEVS